MMIIFVTIQIACFEPGVECSGSTLGNPSNIEKDEKECHAKCIANAKCKFFVFRNNECILLTTCQNKNDNHNAISGKRTDTCLSNGRQKGIL
jgi:hypothetical protein